MSIKEGWVETPEGTRLRYTLQGTGPCIAFCNGIGVSAASFWSEICRALSKTHQTLNWDYRGHGLSDEPFEPESLDIPTCARDLALILDHLELEQVVVAGHSMGVQVSFEFFRHFPQRVLGLIPILGTFQRPFDTFMRFDKSPQALQLLSELVFRFPEASQIMWPHLFHRPLARRVARGIRLVHPSLFPEHELELYLSHLQKISPVVFFHLAKNLQKHSADDILEQIKVPCLIFAGEGDLFTPLELSMEMYQRIPHAEFQLIRHGSHAALVEQPDLFWLRMLFFLQHRIPGYAVEKEKINEMMAPF